MGPANLSCSQQVPQSPISGQVLKYPAANVAKNKDMGQIYRRTGLGGQQLSADRIMIPSFTFSASKNNICKMC